MVRKLKAKKQQQLQQQQHAAAAVAAAAAKEEGIRAAAAVAVASPAEGTSGGAEIESRSAREQARGENKLPVVKQSYVPGQAGMDDCVDLDPSQAACAPAIKFTQPIPPWRAQTVVGGIIPPPEPQSSTAARRKKISVPSPRVVSTKVARIRHTVASSVMKAPSTAPKDAEQRDVSLSVRNSHRGAPRR